jgi:purine-binding chemotaxis protein CheW
MGESIPITDIDESLDSGLGKQDAAQIKQHAVYRMPRWAKAPFQVLMFEVWGVTLGVTLASLLGILELREAIYRLPGQSVWQLGILTHRQQKIVVIDTASLIMPERVGPERVNIDLSGSYLLLIGGGEVGLLFDAINTTLKIDNRGVRWRLGSVRQPWLAGIIIERLSVLMDVDGLLGMIQKT